MFNNPNGVQLATPALIAAIESKRTVTYALPGSDDLRYLDAMGVNGNASGENSILLRHTVPPKITILEEFLHGTQARLGIISERGQHKAEIEVKRFMVRQRNRLGLSDNDVNMLLALEQEERLNER